MTGGAHDMDALATRARAWAADDPDPATRAELEDTLSAVEHGDAEALLRLHDAFDGRLSFGTGGLRARLGAGPKRMNRVVIAQSSAGLAEFLRGRGAAHGSVILGYDARSNSEAFAREAAEVLAGAGLDVTLFDAPVPTPLASFAVRRLGADAGVMITASHNPRDYNGMKVYLGGEDRGAQIATPLDRELAACIERAAEFRHREILRSTQYRLAGPELVAAYVAATVAAVTPVAPAAPAASAPETATAERAEAQPGGDLPSADATRTDPLVVYTAMHGVGAAIARDVFAGAGLPAVIAVPEQDQPDGKFPTLDFPNPEEPGSLDLAFELAREVGAHFVLAHDPDADRLALAAPHPDEECGYRRLNGNELGLLLGKRAVDRAVDRANALPGRTGAPRAGTLVSTIVSSPALGVMARHFGFAHAETLPGFKWVSRVPGLIYGYEEALGYLTTPEVVGDKDGISAAADALALARELHSDGRTVWQALDDLSAQIGHFASAQVVLRRERVPEVEALCAWVRSHPPVAFGERPVRRTRDFMEPGLAPAPSDILAYDLADGSRVMIRPSGTEPKLKVYIDAFSDVGSVEDRRAATRDALRAIEVAVRAYLSETGA